MKIKKYLPIVLVVVGIIAIVVILSTNKNLGTTPSDSNDNNKILFYGDTCPHCKNVEEFMKENGTKDKLDFQELEVYRNPINARLLGTTAKKCGLDSDAGVGVPFFYDGEKCLIGDVDIINYFKQL